MAEFVGKRIIVTGGAGGIGFETARSFMEHGGHVVMVDIDAARLEEAQGKLGRVRLATQVSALDTPQECARVIDSAGAPVFALVHLAGLFEPDAMDPEDHGVWNRAIAANLTTAYDVAVAFATRYDQREPARIVLTSSVAYRRGSADYPPYAAAKGGIVGLTRALSRRRTIWHGSSRIVVRTWTERSNSHKPRRPGCRTHPTSPTHWAGSTSEKVSGHRRLRT